MSAPGKTASNRLTSTIDPTSADFRQNAAEMAALVRDIRRQEDTIGLGGGLAAIERQHAKGRLTAEALLDRYCTLIYAQCGSYEESARRLKLDRRTVKRRVDPALLAALEATRD